MLRILLPSDRHDRPSHSGPVRSFSEEALLDAIGAVVAEQEARSWATFGAALAAREG
jgi:hypothetical protein